MDTLDQLRAFVAVAQAGSFTAGADQIGVSNRLSSKYVAELEARLGVRLFQRTTRKVGLTPAGEDLLARAPALLEELETLLASIAEGSRGLTGTIRIAAPVTFGEVYVGPMLGRFAALHPGLTFDLRLDDGYTDLAATGVDLAFRIGATGMQSLRVRKLGVVRSVLVASPGHIATNGAPDSPEALARHACILDSNRQSPRRWVFLQGGAEHVVHVEGRFQVNSGRAAGALAAAGLGLAYVPRFAIAEALHNGALIPVMTVYEGTATTLSAVYLEGRALPRKVRALIDFAHDDIRAAGIL